MNISIREHIKSNFKNTSKNDLRDSIEQSVVEKDEIVLPGMGVLFEILWKSEKNQEEILDILWNYFNKQGH